MAVKRFPSRLPVRHLDDGVLSVRPVHVGDGYYAVTCTCQVCVEEATTTVPKGMVKRIGDAWLKEHLHDP